MSPPSRAVFLSYASEDAEAAQRIAEALRTAGIEVWFDKDALRGGDAWDRMIRQQIRDCALFMPLISQHSQERLEGYFRLEWKLAVDRSHRMAAERPFIVPVVVDSTPERDALVPDTFRDVQWTHLPGGETPSAFVERVRRLLSPDHAPALDLARSVTDGSLSSAPSLVARPRRRGLQYAAIAAALLLPFGYFGLERLNRSKASVAAGTSIAVLPLANESGEASQQYFSDGISEDLITALSQFPGLRVIGRTSAFQFRESKEDSRSIGAKLGVAHLLEGSVRRSGEMVRVSTELIDTTDGSTQWSERYDRPYKELFALQDEITHAVVGALKTRLLPAEKSSFQSDRPPSGSLEAYNAYLEGRFYYVRDNESDMRNAIERFTTATQLDPGYALAWSALSRSFVRLGENYLSGAPLRDAFARARAPADHALSLAPDLAAAHLARALLLQVVDFDLRGSDMEVRRALELAPADAEAKAFLANQLAAFGEPEKAIKLIHEALFSDPLRSTWYVALAAYYQALNRLDEAERAVDRAIELQPGAQGNHWTLADIKIQRGDAEAAVRAAQQETPGLLRDIALAQALQIGKDRAAADSALTLVIEKYADSWAYQIAEIYAIRQDPDKTFKWLDIAWGYRDAGINALLYDPFILHFKDDPRFAAFCRKVGLPTPAEVAAHKK